MMKISLQGRALLSDSRWNKGSAFTKKEREEFGLVGLLPPHISTIEEQLKRRYETFLTKTTDIAKYIFLVDLQERNEVLFYRLVLDHVEEMLPYVYTPTVGEASLDLNLLLYHQNRGIYLSYDHKDEVEKVLRNTGKGEVDVIVATDGERILGLGDVGIGGMVIPIGKSALYALFAGIRPERLLPVFLDVGTNNEALLNNNLYVGSRHKRITGIEYDQFIDKFVKGVKKVYPKAMLQWEDFAKEHAYPLLERHQKEIPSFNDDIQGTAAVVLAGLLSATRLKGSTLQKERIAIFGAGSAGLGIAGLIIDYLVYSGLSKEEAYNLIYLIDKEGLVHSGPFGKTPTLKTLEEVVSFEKITVLIGTSAQPKTFTEKIVTEMCKTTERPIIFPLSNPNSRCEANPQDLYKWSKGKALVATGSPFPNTPQCNNVYIFPAIGLVASLTPLKEIPTEFFLIAAETLSTSSKNLFPELSELRETTKTIARALLTHLGISKPIEMWHPAYESYEK